MDPNRNNAPAKPAQKADAAAPAAKTVKARVRVGKHFKNHLEGALIDVDPSDLAIHKALLISPDEEETEQAEAQKAIEAARSDTSFFRAARMNGRASVAAVRESIKQRRIAELESLGLKVVQA